MTILIAQPQQDAVIPGWVIDLESFRRWAHSEEFPESGRYAHLDGKLWVDGSLERRLHNDIKTEFNACLAPLAKVNDRGKFHADGMLLTHVAAGLSTVPDGMFISFDSIKTGKLKFERGPDSLEAIGTPDLVLEIVSPTSRHKDTVILPELYHRAGISEYWLVAPMRWEDKITFDILRWTPTGYVAAEKQDEWVESRVFQRSLHLTRGVDPIGEPSFLVEQR